MRGPNQTEIRGLKQTKTKTEMKKMKMEMKKIKMKSKQMKKSTKNIVHICAPKN